MASPAKRSRTPGPADATILRSDEVAEHTLQRLPCLVGQARSESRQAIDHEAHIGPQPATDEQNAAEELVILSLQLRILGRRKVLRRDVELLLHRSPDRVPLLATEPLDV
eukprot:3316464-Rhodomonas_salina.1